MKNTEKMHLSLDDRKQLSKLTVDLYIKRLEKSYEEDKPIVYVESDILTCKHDAVTEFLKPKYEKLANDLIINETAINNASDAATLEKLKEQRIELKSQELLLNDFISSYENVYVKDEKTFLNKTLYGIAWNNYQNKIFEDIKKQAPLPIDLPANTNDIYKENLDKLSAIYGFNDNDKAIITKYLQQCKDRLYDIPSRNPIMMTFYGEQGVGKSGLADLFYEVINNTAKGVTSQIDSILGNFQTTDLLTKLCMKFDEFGRTDKTNTDALKNFIDDTTITINQKYKDPIIGQIKASLILTTNRDPEMLYGSEKCSRRIQVITFKKSLKDIINTNITIDNIKNIVANMWKYVSNGDGDTSSLVAVCHSSDMILQQKKDDDIESAFQEWLTTLDCNQLCSLVTISSKVMFTVSRFQKDFNIISKQTASAYLSQTKYFEKHTSGRMKYYTITKELTTFIASINS